jgi:hypothetical protein
VCHCAHAKQKCSVCIILKMIKYQITIILYRRNFKSFLGGQIPLYFSAYFLFHTYSYERIHLLLSTIEDHLYCQGWPGEKRVRSRTATNSGIITYGRLFLLDHFTVGVFIVIKCWASERNKLILN